MAPDRDESTGQFSEEYSDEAFLQAVSEVEPASTSNVAMAVGCSYDLAYRRLNALAEQGDIKKQEIGGSFVWSRLG